MSLPVSQPLQYQGQAGCYTDAFAGLVYCHHRWYDPAIGRWLSRDPVGLEGGVNVYEYCGSNPLRFVDPSGLQDRPGSVGEPNFAESLWPVWGSGRQALNDYQNGRIGWGIVNTLLAITDCVAVGTVVKSVVKIGVRSTVKIAAKGTWAVARKEIREAGLTKFAGQHMHHPIKQATTKNMSNAVKGILNLPFNVVKIPASRVFKGKTFSMQGWHQLLDGKRVLGIKMTAFERAIYGTNGWHKATAGAVAGHAGLALKSRGD